MLVSTMFSSLSKTKFVILINSILSSSNAFHLNQTRILSFGKELTFDHMTNYWIVQIKSICIKHSRCGSNWKIALKGKKVLIRKSNKKWSVCLNSLPEGKLWKCNSSPDKHVFLYLFPDCLCIIIHFSAYPTTIQAQVLCLFAQVCKRKNPISEPRLNLAVILVTSRYEHNTLPVNSEQWI